VTTSDVHITSEDHVRPSGVLSPVSEELECNLRIVDNDNRLS